MRRELAWVVLCGKISQLSEVQWDIFWSSVPSWAWVNKDGRVQEEKDRQQDPSKRPSLSLLGESISAEDSVPQSPQP